MGGNATLNVSAYVTDGGTLSYQWYRNSTNNNYGGTAVGSNSNSYSPPTGSAGRTWYYVVVTNRNNSVSGTKTATATSYAAMVTVNTLVNAETPYITSHPRSVTVDKDRYITLSVTARVNDGGSLSYRWYRNTWDRNWGGTPVGTNSIYAPPTGKAGTYWYYVEVTNTNNRVNGIKTATVTSVMACVIVNDIVNAATPVISGQPQSVTVSVCESTSLGVAAGVGDGGTLSYRWYRSSTNSNSGGSLVGTSRLYSPPTDTPGIYWYYVEVTNTNNRVNGIRTATVRSYAARVTVVQTWPVTVAPTSNGTVTPGRTSLQVGERVTLTITPAYGYELESIWAYRTGASGTTVFLSGTGNTRTFTMPAYGVTVCATFKPKQGQSDRDDVNSVKASIEGGSYRIAQATANDVASVKAWLINTLSVLFNGSHDIYLRSGETPIVADVKVTSLTRAIAGTTNAPGGTNGSFTFTVTLNRNVAYATATVSTGVIVAMPHVATPVKRIELLPLGGTTIRIFNTGNVPTGDLTLTLTGAYANAFSLSPSAPGSLPAGTETDITLIPYSGLAPGVYALTLTVDADGMTPAFASITYTMTPTGTDGPESLALRAVATGDGFRIQGLVPGETLSVYNMQGQPVYTGIATAAEQRVPVHVHGVYVIVSGLRKVKAAY